MEQQQVTTKVKCTYHYDLVRKLLDTPS